jgi:ATP-dependent Lhr-like helicase
MLSTTRTIIVDEIHAMLGDKRGSHLSLSIERLEKLADKSLVRIGLSATQKPIEKVADFLVGNNTRKCSIINAGHKRPLELKMEVPRSPLAPVMANEVWEEIYDRVEELIAAHNTTLIFVNTRRLAERMSHNLSNRLGEGTVTAHHGSMSKEHRLDAENRLKGGKLKAVIATASLELGIDVGGIDLVCQIGSPKSIAKFLQRVGRSGHTVNGTPKGIIFPLSRDEMIECAALLHSIKLGELDEIIIPVKPLDILAQQIVAELSSRDYEEDELFHLIRKSYPYKEVTRQEFDEIIQMLSEGYTTRRGRRGAYVHHDQINGKLKGRRGSRLTALINSGAIPDNFDYDVIMEPRNLFIGTLNEDFAVESMPGDVFQLGNNSYRILKVETGKVRVEDAMGAPPSIPFWFGEAPGRTRELSEAVSRLRTRIGELVGSPDWEKIGEDDDNSWKTQAMEWIKAEISLPEEICDQIVTYLAATQAALGVMPSRDNLVMERFFDEAGDMHLVIHSPFGSRMNRAWGLALRKRFCRKFNFELQAAATEDNIILSLGATHSFAIDEVFSYLNPKTVRDVLIQALLDAPMFEVRWRWNATRALAILRRRGGKKVPPQIQRSQAEDLVALVFPDQLACLENIVGEREIPDHPLITQTIEDCLHEAMDIIELEKLLTEIKSGKKTLVGKDLRGPSPMAQEIINARPYSFLDNAPLEERRTNAVQSRGWLDPKQAGELSKLDPEAIRAVKEEAWPQVLNEDELHDSLILFSFFSEEEILANTWNEFLEVLHSDNRVVDFKLNSGRKLWVAAERIPQFARIFTVELSKIEINLPEKIASQKWDEEDALREIVRGRIEAMGPVESMDLVQLMELPITKIEQALMALENEGFVLRGSFHGNDEITEWCDRRLLARIHRYTLQTLRKSIEPVSSSDFMRFLFVWQGVDVENKKEGPDGLMKVLEQMEGYEAPAAAWEGDLLPVRVKDYDFFWLDMLCLSGRILWGRFRVNTDNGSKMSSPIKASPIMLIQRDNIGIWKNKLTDVAGLSSNGKLVRDILNENGASFFKDIVNSSGLLALQAEEAIAELIASGLVTSDSYTGLRALLTPAKFKSRRSKNVFSMEQAGRWSIINNESESINEEERTKQLSKVYLRRYGVVFRKLIDKEQGSPAWRDLLKVYRRMEARGEIRGGRFVDGVWGEQYALPEAVSLMRKTRNDKEKAKLVAISAGDPLNLTGIITTGHRVTSITSNRILYEDGEPVAMKEGKEVKFLKQFESPKKWRYKNALITREIPPKLRSYLGRGQIAE